jgi:hypothetical protein
MSGIEKSAEILLAALKKRRNELYVFTGVSTLAGIAMGAYFLRVWPERVTWFHTLILGCWVVLQFAGMDWFLSSRLWELQSGENKAQLIRQYKLRFICVTTALVVATIALAVMYFWFPDQLFKIRTTT